MEATKEQEAEIREPEVIDLEASDLKLEEFLALLDRIDEDDRVYLTRDGRRYVYLRRTRDIMVESTTKEERAANAKGRWKLVQILQNKKLERKQEGNPVPSRT